jgi:hypothetical protein
VGDEQSAHRSRLPFFDKRTLGGAAAGELVIVMARSSVGKTTLGLNIVNNNVNVPTVFFSLEMHGRYLVPRLAAIHTSTPTQDVELALRTGASHPAVDQTVRDFTQLAIVDKGQMSPKKMGDAVKEVHGQWKRKPELVIVDYLELMGGTPSLSEVGKVEKLAWAMKDFAKEHDLVVVLMHQVGRGEGGAGADALSMTSGKYGGEQSADYLLGAYKPALRKGITDEDYLRERWVLYLQFLKTRGGGQIAPQGTPHYVHPDTMKVANSMEEWFTQEELTEAGW